MFEKDLVAGDGPILGKGAYGVTRLSKSSFTGEYYAVRVKRRRRCLATNKSFEEPSSASTLGPTVRCLLLKPTAVTFGSHGCQTPSDRSPSKLQLETGRGVRRPLKIITHTIAPPLGPSSAPRTCRSDRFLL